MRTWAGELVQVAGAEWAKLWSVRSTWWCLAGAVVLMVVSALTLGASTATDMMRERVAPVAFPASGPVVSATSFVQFALIAPAMLVITSEYASGGIRSTLQATPVRGRVIAAKALVVMPVMFAAGVVSGGLATAVVHAVLSIDVFGGFATLPPGETALALLAVGCYLALVSAMTIGVGAAMRSAAGTLTVVFMLLMGLPLMLLMAGGPAGAAVALRMPMFAGLAFMGGTGDLTGGPIAYPAGEGLAWLLAWTAVALAAGHAVLRARDA